MFLKAARFELCWAFRAFFFAIRVISKARHELSNCSTRRIMAKRWFPQSDFWPQDFHHVWIQLQIFKCLLRGFLACRSDTMLRGVEISSRDICIAILFFFFSREIISQILLIFVLAVSLLFLQGAFVFAACVLFWPSHCVGSCGKCCHHVRSLSGNEWYGSSTRWSVLRDAWYSNELLCVNENRRQCKQCWLRLESWAKTIEISLLFTRFFLFLISSILYRFPLSLSMLVADVCSKNLVDGVFFCFIGKFLAVRNQNEKN